EGLSAHSRLSNLRRQPLTPTLSPQEWGEGEALHRLTETLIVATVPGKRAMSDPDLRDRLYELLEHDHLPYSVGSRFVRLIIVVIVVDVLAAILASVPEFDARLGRLFTAIEVAAIAAFALEYVARIWSVVGHSLRDM